MNGVPPSFLRVMLRKPGFFLVDSVVSLAVDGVPVYNGSFMAGFDWWAPIAVGRHHVHGRLHGFVTRQKAWIIDVYPAKTTLVTLAYSRFWGTFDDPPLIAFSQS